MWRPWACSAPLGALAAIADDGDLLALDQILVGVAIVINLHVFLPYYSSSQRKLGSVSVLN
ncbi:hypothetical protein, partial [Blastomonas fulva]|uniref:hypothetical protein n=1 Tax=Blastomonas fulva TaxID=1550728 RepID=UPI004033BB50